MCQETGSLCNVSSGVSPSHKVTTSQFQEPSFDDLIQLNPLPQPPPLNTIVSLSASTYLLMWTQFEIMNPLGTYCNHAQPLAFVDEHLGWRVLYNRHYSNQNGWHVPEIYVVCCW